MTERKWATDEQKRQHAIACELMELRIGELYIQGLDEELQKTPDRALMASLEAQRRAIFYERKDLKACDSAAVAKAIRKYTPSKN